MLPLSSVCRQGQPLRTVHVKIGLRNCEVGEVTGAKLDQTFYTAAALNAKIDALLKRAPCYQTHLEIDNSSDEEFELLQTGTMTFWIVSRRCSGPQLSQTNLSLHPSRSSALTSANAN